MSLTSDNPPPLPVLQQVIRKRRQKTTTAINTLFFPSLFEAVVYSFVAFLPHLPSLKSFVAEIIFNSKPEKRQPVLYMWFVVISSPLHPQQAQGLAYVWVRLSSELHVHT